MNRITTATLAKYIGSECEMKAINTHKLHGCEDGTYPINGSTISIVEAMEIEPCALILRPVERMTEEDIIGLTSDKVTIECTLRDVKKHGISGIFSWLRDHSEVFIVDYLRSKGFDLGGEIETYKAVHSDRPFDSSVKIETEIIWVPSLIEAGVAKEAKL